MWTVEFNVVVDGKPDSASIDCFSYVVKIWQCDTKITIFTDITDAENINSDDNRIHSDYMCLAIMLQNKYIYNIILLF